MFATLMRRWRIVVPTVTALVAIGIMVSVMIAPASAASSHKTLHFRFSGDAADFINFTQSPAFFDCFSGFLDPAGGSNIHASFSACDAPGFNHTGPDGETFHLAGDVAGWNVTADHTSKEGHAIAQSEVAGDICVSVDQGSTCGDPSPNVIAPNDDLTLLQSDDVQETAEAECQSHNGHTPVADARSTASISNLELFTRANDDPKLANDAENALDAVVQASTQQNQALVITREFDVETPHLHSLILTLTVNEHTIWQSGDAAAVTANGLRVVVTDSDGNILFDMALAHAHANIHCDFHSFSFEDPIGA